MYLLSVQGCSSFSQNFWKKNAVFILNVTDIDTVES